MLLCRCVHHSIFSFSPSGRTISLLTLYPPHFAVVSRVKKSALRRVYQHIPVICTCGLTLTSLRTTVVWGESFFWSDDAATLMVLHTYLDPFFACLLVERFIIYVDYDFQDAYSEGASLITVVLLVHLQPRVVFVSRVGCVANLFTVSSTRLSLIPHSNPLVVRLTRSAVRVFGIYKCSAGHGALAPGVIHVGPELHFICFPTLTPSLVVLLLLDTLRVPSEYVRASAGVPGIAGYSVLLDILAFNIYY